MPTKYSVSLLSGKIYIKDRESGREIVFDQIGDVEFYDGEDTRIDLDPIIADWKTTEITGTITMSFRQRVKLFGFWQVFKSLFRRNKR